jgi:MFS family permease
MLSPQANSTRPQRPVLGSWPANISLLGDRIHQVALAFVILNATESPMAVGAIFLVATLPNLLFGPIAAALVDRWDHREVMIVSDLLRAGVVLLIPIAVVTDLILVYPSSSS